MPASGQGMLTELHSKLPLGCGRVHYHSHDVQAETSRFATGRHAAKGTVRIEVTSLIAVEGDIEYRWVIVEGTLRPVS